MSDSLQHKLDRVRRPRVQITYDVETGGAQEAKELPFVVGVMADLSGMPKEANKPLKERKFTPIDRDNFNDVLAKSSPRVAVQVPNKLTGDKDQLLNAEITFKSMDDFAPDRIVEQVEPLREIMRARERLNELLAKMSVNQKLENLLEKVLEDTTARDELAKTLGIGKSGGGDTGGEG